MSRLTQLIREIHRRSLWQVLGIYLAASWVVLQVIETLTSSVNLPQWLPAVAVVLLLLGLPVVLATAFIQEGPRAEPEPRTSAEPVDVPAGPGPTAEPSSATPGGAVRHLLTWRNTLLAGMAAFALWGVVAAGWLLLQNGGSDASAAREATSAGTRIAVLPFTVRGGGEFAYLGEGMVDLLGTKLDGAGELRRIDPRVVLGQVAREGGGASDPRSTREVAARLGAHLYVLGNIVAIGEQLRLDASLYSLNAGLEPIAEGSAEGDASRIFDLVDDVATQLLAGRSEGPGQRVTRLAAVTTHSLPALKAYLEGERAFRAGQFTSALEAFQRAVQTDSTFALAWYRLSVAAEWAVRSDIFRVASAQAYRHSDRLSEHDRSLLQAHLAWRTGNGREAERLYRGIVGAYPDDVEAWFQLGEVLFHYGPYHGGTIRESREAWERVLSYEPDHLQALWHLARIANREGRLAELDTLVDRILELNPEGDRALEMVAMRAFALGDTAGQRLAVNALRDATDGTLVIAVWNVATYSNDWTGARKLAPLMTETSRSSEMRALGHIWIAHLELAEGRWLRAKEELAEASRLNPAPGLEYRVLLALAPFVGTPTAELATLRRRMEEWDASAVPPSANPSDWFSIHDGLHPLLKAYALGILSARLGDYAAARRYAEDAATIDVPDEDARPFKEQVTGTIRAEIALDQGQVADALAAAGAEPSHVWYQLALTSPFLSQTHERYLRAELLRELGRYDEALDLYNSFDELSVYDLAYIAPSHLRRAEIHEQLGQTEEAARHYARFIELWRDCDPDLRPMVEAAERAVAALAPDRAA